MSGTASVNTPFAASAAVDREIRFAATHGILFGAIEAPSALQQGSITVVDAQGERAESLTQAPHVRATFTSPGDVTLRLRNDQSSEARGLVAQLPAGMIPDRAWAATLASS